MTVTIAALLDLLFAIGFMNISAVNIACRVASSNTGFWPAIAQLLFP
jgi:hypothetical protein